MKKNNCKEVIAAGITATNISSSSSSSMTTSYNLLIKRLMGQLEQTNQKVDHHIDENINRNFRRKTPSEQCYIKQQLKGNLKQTLNNFFDQLIEEMEKYYLLDENNRIHRRRTAQYLIESHYTPISVHHRYQPKLNSPLVKQGITLFNGNPFDDNDNDESSRIMIMMTEQQQINIKKEIEEEQKISYGKTSFLNYLKIYF